MALQNSWVGYLTRSYSSIKQSLLSRLVTSNPEITDHSDSNILVVIISMFAGVVEMLGYYIDNMAREAFIATARKFTSMVKLIKILDYRIKTAYPSTADVLFTFSTPITGSCVIPIGTEVKTANNISFFTTENRVLSPGDTSALIGVKEVTHSTGNNLGTTDGTNNQAFALPALVVDSSTIVTVGGDLYTEVRTLGFSGPLDKHYIVDVDVDGIAYIIFGNGINGIIPPALNSVDADYDTTTAELGNTNANTITTLVSTLALVPSLTTTVTNPLASSGGTSYENIEKIRVNAPLSIRTLDRAVTRQDYIDISRMAPGVGRAEVIFNCGKKVYIYIAPEGGGIAQAPLLFTTANYVEIRKMITTFIEVIAAGETGIILTLNVTIKYRVIPANAITDINTALVDYGSFNKQNINKKIRISDIIALVDNLEKVENVDLVLLATRPYARPQNHTNPLIWVAKSLTNQNAADTWKISYGGGTIWYLHKNNIYQGTATTNILWTDSNIEFTIQASAYVVGQTWIFKVYPSNQNINIDDLTIPKLDIADVILNITEQLIPPIE